MPKSVLQCKVDDQMDELLRVSSLTPTRFDQVIYVPNHHLKNMKDHTAWHYPNGVQPGFVYSITPEGRIFVRYWRWDWKLKNYVSELRTLANSELTPSENLFYFKFFKDSDVTRAVLEITKGE